MNLLITALIALPLVLTAVAILLSRLPDEQADLAELRAVRERKQARKEGSK
ncbi:hypothetical protein GCM10007147_44990 [Nocardiopsis kunsanensis]|uniref:Uncharacterized protein n=1 Tax=Nocardiopsis kunsanensis TaxID=141693 RepID=A0A919CLX6_9ACTN|nr:hypothetical protein [Nocardiopsis kunsanensis]GHD37156.1 hypothetical protein GCM10007147_44990 [Nocardiopsis kunsanensis]